MIKVSFLRKKQLVGYFEDAPVIADFIFCKSVLKYSKVLFPTIKNDILYVPRTRNYIKSIEYVKPTDL